MHPVEDIGISPWPVDVVEFGTDVYTHRSRLTSDNHITRCHRRLESVGVPAAVGDRMPAEWELAPDWGLVPSVTHGWAAQPRLERSAAMVRRTLGQYIAVCLRLQLTSHTQETSTLLNKVWEVYFYEEACSFVRSFVHWSRHYVWVCFRNILVSWLWNKLTLGHIRPRMMGLIK